MEKIVKINGDQYRITSDKNLSNLEMEQVLNVIRNPTCGSCGSHNTMNIKSLTKTCTRTTAKVGDVILMRATGTGGTPNYSIVFKKGGTAIPGCSYTGVGSGTEKTCSYTIVSGDTFPITFSVLITDANDQTCTESCTITQLPTPTCDFTVT